MIFLSEKGTVTYGRSLMARHHHSSASIHWPSARCVVPRLLIASTYMIQQKKTRVDGEFMRSNGGEAVDVLVVDNV